MELLVVLAIALSAAVGYSILRNFTSLKLSLLLLPCSFGLGIGLLAFQLYFYSRMDISWNIVNIILPWVFIASFSFWKKKFSTSRFYIPRLAKLDIFLLSLIVSLVIFVAFESTLRPVVAWDGWAIWLLKSKIFFLDGAIHASIFPYVESSYPLLVSLMYSYLYIAIGVVDDRSVLLLSSVFYLMLGIGFFAYLKEKTSLTYGLVGTFLLLSTQNIVRHGGRFEAGQADIILAFYMLITGVLLMKYLATRKLAILVLLQVILGITALIKNEGLVYSLLVQIVLGFTMIKNKNYTLLSSSIIWIVPVVDWEYYKFSNAIPKLSEVFVGNAVHFTSLLQILYAMLLEFVNIQNWNLLWIAFFVVIILYNTKIRKSGLMPLYILIFLQLCLYLGLYMIFPGDPITLVNGSFNRLLLQLAPLAFLVSLIMAYPSIKNIRVFKSIL